MLFHSVNDFHINDNKEWEIWQLKVFQIFSHHLTIAFKGFLCFFGYMFIRRKLKIQHCLIWMWFNLNPRLGFGKCRNQEQDHDFSCQLCNMAMYKEKKVDPKHFLHILIRQTNTHQTIKNIYTQCYFFFNYQLTFFIQNICKAAREKSCL